MRGEMECTDTNDTAYMDEDGYFWYVGRADDLIKTEDTE